MLTVIAIWIYILVTAYITGYAVLACLCRRFFSYSGREKKRRIYQVRHRTAYLFAGLAVNTLYAEIFSLFHGVGLEANLVLVAICVLLLLFFSKEAKKECSECFLKIRLTKSAWFFVGVFLVMAYGTSHGYAHYDTGLYHAQAIHWIESFGVVKGLGNLHVRLAYNSAAFPLCALYSFSFLKGQSFHTVSGFFCLVLAFQCLELRDIARRRALLVSDVARLVALLYLYSVYDEMISPASDYFVTVLVFYIVIAYLDLSVKKERSYAPYAFLFLLSVYALTIKLSAGMMVWVAVKPAVMLFRERGRKAWKVLAALFLLAGLVAVPFLLRNVLLSGWLIYPFAGLDLFAVDWKIPKGELLYDAKEIAAYGRGYHSASMADGPFLLWVRDWFRQQTVSLRLLWVADLCGLLLTVPALCKWLILLRREKVFGKKKLRPHGIFPLNARWQTGYADFLLIEAVLYASFLFWFLTAPLLRYGYAYVYLPAALMVCWLWIWFRLLFTKREKTAGGREAEDRGGCGLPRESGLKIGNRILIFLVAVLLLYKSGRLFLSEAKKFQLSYLVCQEDYERFRMQPFYLDGIRFYRPVEGDRAGYSPFPSAPALPRAKLRGPSIREGFRSDP